MKMRLIAIIIVLAQGLTGFAQNEFAKYTDPKILSLFSEEDVAKMRTSDKLNLESEAFFAEWNNLFSEIGQLQSQLDAMTNASVSGSLKQELQKSEKIALSNLHQAIDLQYKSIQIKYSVYKKNLEIVRSKVDRVRLIQGQEIENEADTLFQRGKKIRESALISDNYDKLTIYEKAYKTELKAIDKQIETYYYYFDWVLDNPDIERTNTENLNNKNTRFHQNIPIYRILILEAKKQLSEKDAIELYDGPEIIYIEYINGLYRYMLGAFNSIADAEEVKDKEALTNAKIIKTDTNNSDGIPVKEIANRPSRLYQIQISATQQPAPELSIKKLNPFQDYVYTIQENGWYKYTIGRFKTYTEAKLYKDKMKIKGAFIVINDNNRLINIVDE